MINDKRNLIIHHAWEKYVATGITLNITEALKLYLANDADSDEQIPLFITTPEIHQVREILRTFRPICEECGSPISLQVNAKDHSGKEYPSAWVCKNCGIENYSEKSPKEWLKIIQDENRK